MKRSRALLLKNEAIRDAGHRCTDEDGSDLDLLVDPLPETTLFDLGGLQVELESRLGVPVDIRTPGDLPPQFRAGGVAESRLI